MRCRCPLLPLIAALLALAPAALFAQPPSPQPAQPITAKGTKALTDRVNALELRVAAAERHIENKQEHVHLLGHGPLWFSALLQTRWTGVFASDSQAGAAPQTEFSWSFTVPRARIGINGDVGPLRYVLTGELGQLRRERGALADAFIEARWPFEQIHGGRTELHARAGQFKVPMSPLMRINEPDRLFVERPVSVDALGFDRDVGLALDIVHGGHWWILESTAGLWNGAGANRLDPRDMPLLLARIELGLGPSIHGQRAADIEGPDERGPLAVRVGAAVAFQRAPAPSVGIAGAAGQSPPVFDTDADRDGRRDTVGLTTIGADLTARLRAIAFEAEALCRREADGRFGAAQSPPRSFDEWLFGGVVQLSYDLRWLPDHVVFPSGGVQIGVRAAATEVSPLVTGGIQGPLLGDLRTELGGLVSYLVNERDIGGLGARLRAHYSYLRWSTEGAAEPTLPGEHRLILEAQLAHFGR
ncbi:MAG TPA: hypothetical protein VK459_27905 [Polyangiaceae bacterium]|nr:hypothetical protein [Polyangiaceae bacterium]